MSENHQAVLSVLCIPLYKLHYLDEIADQPLTQRELEQLYTDYDGDEIQRLFSSLEWAYNHPHYPFSSLFPGVRFSDQEAYRYLVNLLRQLKASRPGTAS
jgi:hypothetical protein